MSPVGAGPSFRLLPRLPPVELRTFGLAAIVLPVVALVLSLARWHDGAGHAAARYGLVASSGPGIVGLAGGTLDRPLGGYPLDAVLTLPIAWLGEGWPAVSATVWCVVAGATAAWLATAWWGNAVAGVVAGVVWQGIASDELAAGRPGGVLALALLPLAWGLTIRALERGVLAVAVAGVTAGLLLALSAQEAAAWLVLAAVSAGVGVRQVGARVALSRIVGTVAVALLVATPALVLRGDEGDPPQRIVMTLVGFALAAGVLLRRDAARALLLVLAVLAGLGPVPVESAAALGLVLLAVGAVPPLVQRGVSELAKRDAALAKT